MPEQRTQIEMDSVIYQKAIRTFVKTLREVDRQVITEEQLGLLDNELQVIYNICERHGQIQNSPVARQYRYTQMFAQTTSDLHNMTDVKDMDALIRARRLGQIKITLDVFILNGEIELERVNSK